jgi:hypothetical protein
MKCKYICMWLLAAIPVLSFQACSDDPEPLPKAKITFSETSARRSESDGTPRTFHPELGLYLGWGVSEGGSVAFNIKFDKPLDNSAVIAYKLAGTASPVNPGTSNDIGVNDYAVRRSGKGYIFDNNYLTVEKGVSEIQVIIEFYEDLEFEVDDSAYDETTDTYQETAVFTLESVYSGPVELDPANLPKYTLTIEEDDFFVGLYWDVSDAGISGPWDGGDVDLDLLFTKGTSILNYSNLSTASVPYEALFVPGGFPGDTYDIKCPFPGGSTALDFYIRYVNLGGTIGSGAEKSAVFSGHYTLDNLNDYTHPQSDNYAGQPRSVQKITKFNRNYPQITDVQVGANGSRLKENPVTPAYRHESLRTWLRVNRMSLPTNMLRKPQKN